MPFTDHGTITTSHKLNKLYYNGTFLEGQEQYVVWDQFVAERQKDIDIPLNAGEKVEFTRVAPFKKKRTPATKTYGNIVQATVLEYGDYIKPSKKFWLTNMDKNLKENAFELGKAAASTIDSLIWEAIVKGGIGLRSDADGNESGERSCVASGSSSTRVVFSVALSGLAQNDVGVVVFLTGKNAGQVREFVCDDTNPTTEIVVDALDHTVEDDDLIRIVTTQGLTTGDKINAEMIRKSVALLESNGTPTFDDGYYHAIYDPLQKYDFQRDTEWTNLKHYAAPKDLYRNLEGEIFGTKFHKDLVPYRSTPSTTGDLDYSETGTVYALSIFGKGAFGNVRLKGVNQKFYICPPVATTENALAMYGTLGWYELCCPTVLDGRRIVNIFSVPTKF